MCSIPGGCNGGKIFAQRLDHPPSPYPETSADSHSAVQKQPDGCGWSGHHRAALIQKPESHQGANCIASDKMANINPLNKQDIHKILRRNHCTTYLTSFPPWAKEPKHAVRICRNWKSIETAGWSTSSSSSSRSRFLSVSRFTLQSWTTLLLVTIELELLTLSTLDLLCRAPSWSLFFKSPWMP